MRGLISSSCRLTFVKVCLPYARPMFVRVCATFDMTATFKLTKPIGGRRIFVRERSGVGIRARRRRLCPYNHGSV